MSTLDTSTSSNPANVSMRPVTLRWGLIWAGTSILLTIIGFLTNTDPSSAETGMGVKMFYGLISFAIVIVSIVMAIKQHRDNDLGGYITLGRGLMVGLMTSLLAGIFSAVFFIIYATVINPDFAETLKEGMVAQWEAQGMSEEQIETASGFGFIFANPFVMAAMQLFGALFYGLLIGLIGGAVLKKETPQQTL